MQGLFSWATLYLVLPFVLAAWIKTVSHWFMHNVQLRALEQIPGGESDPTLKDGQRRELILQHIQHAEERTFTLFTYTSSIVAGFLVGVGSGRLAAPVVGSALLAASLIGLVPWLNSIPAGGLSLPIRGGPHGKWLRGSTLLYLLNVLADLMLIVLIAIDRYQTVTTVPP
jgi:hypothetical protein